MFLGWRSDTPQPANDRKHQVPPATALLIKPRQSAAIDTDFGSLITVSDEGEPLQGLRAVVHGLGDWHIGYG